MEVYVLDSLLRRSEVIDRFESLVWTERFSDVGDFELDIKSNSQTRGLLTTGVKLAINESYRVMTVETVEDSTDTEGKLLLKVAGRSLEAVMDDRVVRNAAVDSTTEPSWGFLDTPGNICRTMFDHICRAGALDYHDRIPFIQPEGPSMFPNSTIPETSTPIALVQPPDSLLNAIKKICDQYELGFRLVRNFDRSQLYFDVYSGNDRTSRQTLFSPIIFAPDFDNLLTTTEFSNILGTKNVAYVISPAGWKVVYPDHMDPDIDGFDRRVLYVDASDVTTDTYSDVDTELTQRGMDALMQNRAQSIFDGELNQYGEYKYGRDYELGDLVELRNRDGIITYKRVTEHIFASDSNGDRSYPTLVQDLFAGENDWLSYSSKSTVWADLDDDATAWSDLTT